MSRIYKILYDNGSGNKEMFAIKPFLGRFEDFKDEIFIRLPELKNKTLKFYYEDADGDNITIFNTNDFAIFQEQDINKVFVVVQGSNDAPKTDGSSRALLQDLVWTNAQPKPSLKKMPSSASADELRKFLHSGVICDHCDKEIRGYRYKCLECPDFDLCMDCETNNHNSHLLIRIANPSDSDIFYRAKLGKRFGRHRRSESLCTKPDDHHDKKVHEKKTHHKRHAPRSASNLTELISDVLKSVVNPIDVQVETNNSNDGDKNTASGVSTAVPKSLATATMTTTTPSNTPLQSECIPVFPDFGIKRNASGQVNLKSSIDTLSNIAQNFAAMMDPFATFVSEAAKANAANASTAQESATRNSNDNENSSVPMEGITTDNKSKTVEPQATKENDVMIVDCSDDEEKDKISGQRISREGSSASDVSQVAANLNKDGSSSPSHEWAFVNANDINDSAPDGAVARATGTIPKKPTPPSTVNETVEESPRLDYGELSRRLNDHIAAEKLTDSVANMSTKFKETVSTKDLEEAVLSANRMGEYLRATKKSTDPSKMVDASANSATTSNAPRRTVDPRIIQAVNTMVAMGFSNEGGWLNQLLEAVNGDITSAIELMTPHK